METRGGGDELKVLQGGSLSWKERRDEPGRQTWSGCGLLAWTFGDRLDTGSEEPYGRCGRRRLGVEAKFTQSDRR